MSESKRKPNVHLTTSHVNSLKIGSSIWEKTDSSKPRLNFWQRKKTSEERGPLNSVVREVIAEAKLRRADMTAHLRDFDENNVFSTALVRKTLRATGITHPYGAFAFQAGRVAGRRDLTTENKDDLVSQGNIQGGNQVAKSGALHQAFIPLVIDIPSENFGDGPTKSRQKLMDVKSWGKKDQ
ncbi:hypothetical protein CONPUDRAFT_71879 [Coniophora puteana RWD-64-598 SS2]|uniref:Uncharacterized protein n=1 Tax=Coniophora puteana (strain RWD-64-598) TaxID=741705 RepID=A0A5M3MX10_CONPW|nr:uncharacterized protein CONPUDRAFT_71879 [Coniophora puteana RWD-64-598 SS2]EIW83294.1 hypothetical protein CONPUDRAFT_71879 [Coniophora puteana RWD-64-598 SS2]